MTEKWTGGFVASVWWLGLLTLAALAVVAFTAWCAAVEPEVPSYYEDSDNRDAWIKGQKRKNRKTALIAVGVTLGVWAILAGITACALYPFEAAYHRWAPVSGTVAEAGAYLVGADDKFHQVAVITLEGVAGELRCEDSRCALLEPGDRVTLRCVKDWSYAATDGRQCSWISRED